jgi:NADPH:quinone reductase-like Zn-dependent oxidoreductase
MTRIIICGARRWYPWAALEDRMKLFPKGTTVVHGGCAGVDTAAGHVAKKLGFAVEVFRAMWELGPQAGPMRNRQMLQAGADLVIAFHWDKALGKGTRDCILQAKGRRVPVEINLLSYDEGDGPG